MSDIVLLPLTLSRSYGNCQEGLSFPGEPELCAVVENSATARMQELYSEEGFVVKRRFGNLPTPRPSNTFRATLLNQIEWQSVS